MLGTNHSHETGSSDGVQIIVCNAINSNDDQRQHMYCCMLGEISRKRHRNKDKTAKYYTKLVWVGGGRARAGAGESESGEIITRKKKAMLMLLGLGVGKKKRIRGGCEDQGKDGGL